MRTLFLLGAGVAAYGVARFARTAITEERQRREHEHATDQVNRWEDEGNAAFSPATTLGSSASHTMHEPAM